MKKQPVRPMPQPSINWRRFSFIIIPCLFAFISLSTVRSLFSAPLTPPLPPVITEPLVDGQIVSPSDVHMETAPMSDPDGHEHQCSDWQIIISDTQELIWQTVCIGGVERLHTHLGDGTFMGSYNGRTELHYDTDYIMQVRHIDDNNEISPWSQRLFRTGPATQLFPLQLDDVLAVPAPQWVDTASAPVILPPGAPQPFLKLESPTGQNLLQINGFDGATNQIINPAPLPAHVNARLQIHAGNTGLYLTLPETDLTFVDNANNIRTIYLPAMSITPTQTLYFWISANGSTYAGSAGQTEPDFSALVRGAPVPWIALQPGYKVEVVATGFQLPVHIAFVPEGVYPGNPDDPFYYVAELYGKIKVVTRGGAVYDYATDLLNFNPTGNFPGSGEQGVAGVTIDPASGDVFATMLYSSDPADDTAPHYPKVVRFQSADGGISASTQITILNMVGESQGQSHQISNISVGPDNKLYVHMGDGFDANTALNLNSFRGKILRLNLDGSAPPDNPFYTGGGSAPDYIYAYGVRNPFGGDWRDADGTLYQVENGPSIDRLSRIISGTSYGWNGTNNSMLINAIYNWSPSHAPVDIAFIQNSTFGGSGFPAAKLDHAFVTESGPTWASGPQTRGKRIVEFVIDTDGNLITGPVKLVEYNGTGKASAAGMAAGPDGLYFSDLYKDMNYASPVDAGANILRVRFVGVADFVGAPRLGLAPLTVTFTDTSDVPDAIAWFWDFGDGATSTVPNPTHTYTQNGVFDVTLRVTGLNGISVERKPGYVLVGQVGNGIGVLGQYYEFTGPTPPTDPFQTFRLERIDSTIDFDWGAGSPDPAIDDDLFSIQWQGQVQPLYSELYTFYTWSGDGIRLWVDGQLVVDDWSNHAARERSGDIWLQAGQRYDMEVHYYENTGNAAVAISWESASQVKEIIPAAYLYPPADLAVAAAAQPDPAVAGGYITYTLVVTNNGPYSATAVTFSNTLSAGLTFVSGANCSVNGSGVTCAVGDIGVGATATASFAAHVSLTAVEPLSNLVEVHSSSLDHVAANNQTSVSTAVNASAPPRIYVASSLPVCNFLSPCTDDVFAAFDTVADAGWITILDDYTVPAGLSSGNGGANQVLVDGPGTLTWDGSYGEALFTVGSGDVTFDGISMAAIAPGTAVSVTGSGNLTIQHSAHSIMSFDTAVHMAGSGTAVIKGNRFAGNLTVFAQSSGTLLAYANNIEGFNTALDHSGGSPHLKHNWWGAYSGPAPVGLDAAAWAARLGAPMQSWAEGSGSASLGAAQLSGGSGTAVVVSHGRDHHPFGSGISANPADLCSDYYDFFTVNASGLWRVATPVDDNAACNQRALAALRLYWIPDITACGPSGNNACWQLRLGVTAEGQTLAAAGLSVADLGGTPFAAGSSEGGGSTAVYLPVVLKP